MKIFKKNTTGKLKQEEEVFLKLAMFYRSVGKSNIFFKLLIIVLSHFVLCVLQTV